MHRSGKKTKAVAYGPEPTPTKQNARAGQLYQTFRKYFEGNGVKDFSWENNIEPALRDMLGLIDAASERKTGASDKKLSPASLVVALRPRLGLKPMVISVSNHGRRVVKSGTPSSTPCVSGGHVSSALETPDMVTSADLSGVHQT